MTLAASGLSMNISTLGMRFFSARLLSSSKSSCVRSNAKAGMRSTPPRLIVSVTAFLMICAASSFDLAIIVADSSSTFLLASSVKAYHRHL